MKVRVLGGPALKIFYWPGPENILLAAPYKISTKFY